MRYFYIFIIILICSYSCSRTPISNEAYIYDENGKKIKITLGENPKGDILMKEYNENGKLKKITLKNDNNEIINVQEYDGNEKVHKIYKYYDNKLTDISEYNDSGAKVKETLFDDDNKFVIYKYEYNNEILVSKTMLDKNNIIISKEQYTYDETGVKTGHTISQESSKKQFSYTTNIINETHLDQKGVVLYDYEKNTKSNTDKYTYYKNGVKDNTIEYSISDKTVRKTTYIDNKILTHTEFDFAGNKIKESKYNNGELENFVQYEYNENGKQLSQKKYTKDNKLTRFYKYIYDKKGNITKITTYDGDGQVVEYE